MPEDSRTLECGGCGAPLHAAVASASVENRPACAACGSSSIVVKVYATDTITVHESVGVKARHTGGGKPFLEQKGGDDFHRDTQTWSKLHRIIDRENDRYVERVVDHEGIVVRDVDEPLSKHVGGSAKKRPPAAAP